jgi:rsbT co-antagonist protein RsbR
MGAEQGRNLVDLIERDEAELLDGWLQAQARSSGRRSDLLTDAELRQQSGEFLRAFTAAARQAGVSEAKGPGWAGVRELLGGMSRTRAQRGFSPSETAVFVLSLKQPLYARIQAEYASDPDALAREFWAATAVLDDLALFTTEVHQQSREDLIRRQQQELLELSTPVVKLWDGVVAVPLIGTLDSARTQIVMESLLERIVETGASIAIIDITGVPTVDTLVAQHLIKTVAAARLMGAECIISGIRPQIAQTIVHLGVVLENVTTKASLADAIVTAFHRLGVTIHRARA